MSLKKLIQESLINYNILNENDCDCGCDECNDQMVLLENKAPISEGLRYHIENDISLQDNVFRIGSKKYLQLFAEARMLNEWGTIQLDENSRHLVENTDIGKFGVFEGERVPLDIPNINEEELGEAKKKKKKKDPPIGKPKRGGSKAYYVYVRNPKTKKIKKISFGSGGLRAKIRNPKARAAFAARHNCKNKKDRTKAGYWSCNLPRYAPALGLGPKMNTFW
tara:strand:- start:215 stop:880 length:666 start_codon:yes stop_codon:yes gene_type:complete